LTIFIFTWLLRLLFLASLAIWVGAMFRAGQWLVLREYPSALEVILITSCALLNIIGCLCVGKLMFGHW